MVFNPAVLLPLAVVTALVFAIVVLVAKPSGWLWGHTPRVRAKRVLTANETEFLSRLRRALPDHEVLPQVAMGALLDVNLPESHPDYWHLRREFAQKVVDYVVCRPKSLEVLAVVELDDRTHDIKRDKDAARDALLLSAGIRTLRWDSRAKPTTAEIASCFAPLAKRPTV